MLQCHQNIHTGQMELSQNDVFFVKLPDKCLSGFIDFFAEADGQHFVIYEVLLPDKEPLYGACKFRRTGEHEAIHCSQEALFSRPAWWMVEDNSVLCLL